MTQEEFNDFVANIIKNGNEPEHRKRELLSQIGRKPALRHDRVNVKRIVKIVEKPKYGHFLRMREVAKIASDNYGIEIGQNRLFDKLREWGLIIPHSTEPYQSAVRNGYFVVLPKFIDTPSGGMIVTWPKVTNKGVAYICNRLRKEQESL